MHIYWRLICSKTITRYSLCIRSCKWFHWTLLFERYFESVCSFLFSVFCFCFVHSFLHLVQSQNDCYKVRSTTSWLTYCCWHSLLDGMFHNKEREMTFDMLLHWYLVGTNCMSCVDILNILFSYFMDKLKDLCSIVCVLQLFRSFSPHTEKEWNIKH